MKAWFQKSYVMSNITSYFQHIYNYCTNKLWNFQYKILNMTLTTNVLLYRWNMHDNEFCTFFKSANETIEHVLYECPLVQIYGLIFNNICYLEVCSVHSPYLKWFAIMLAWYRWLNIISLVCWWMFLILIVWCIRWIFSRWE